MDPAVARKLTDELPTPLAELVARALAARKGRDRHDAVFYLGEATIKLAASVRIARWLDAALTPGSDLARRLESVVAPSLGHWCAFFREAGQALSAKDDALFSRAEAKELEKTPASSTAIAALAEGLVRWDVADAETVKRLSRRGVIGFFEALVAYRNAVLGHGAQRSPSFYEEAAELLFAALAEVLRSPALFGGLQLAVAEIDVDARGKGTHATWRELRGMVPVPLDEEAKDARPGELYFRGERGLVSIHPFVILVPDEESLHFAFLNRAVEKREQLQRADYLDYRTSDVIDDVDAMAALSGVLTRLRGKPTDAEAVKELAKTIGAAPAPDASVADSESWIDRVIAGKYRITGKLGEGGMGTVYAAEHVELPRSYAVKTILPRLAKSEELVERFRREAFASAKLRHPGIVDVLDFGRLDDGTVYMVMERLEGRSLEDAKTLSIEEVTAIARQVLDALAVAHASGLVHRDLKPANLFETADHQVKVLDFGIAKMTEVGERPELTSADVILGTPLYMAPEQIAASSEVDARADLYAVGATLYRLLTGASPAAGGHAHLVVARVASGDIERDPRKKRPEVPDALAHVIMRALAKAPGERFATAKEMRAALDAPAPAPSPARTRRALAAAAGLVLLVGIGLLVTRSPSPPSAANATSAASATIAAARADVTQTAVVEAGPMTAEAIHRRFAASVVYLEVIDGKGARAGGTGLVADRQGMILTPSYAADPKAKSVTVRFRNGAEVDKVTFVLFSEERQLSILRADVAHPSVGTVPELTPFTFRMDDDVELGTRLFELGYPRGQRELTLREGMKSSNRPVPQYEWFGASLQVEPGESGAPVLDTEGRVVGMVAGMTKTEALIMPASAFRADAKREAR